MFVNLCGYRVEICAVGMEMRKIFSCGGDRRHGTNLEAGSKEAYSAHFLPINKSIV
jgi:hypothetical protein